MQANLTQAATLDSTLLPVPHEATELPLELLALVGGGEGIMTDL